MGYVVLFPNICWWHVQACMHVAIWAETNIGSQLATLPTNSCHFCSLHCWKYLHCVSCCIIWSYSRVGGFWCCVGLDGCQTRLIFLNEQKSTPYTWVSLQLASVCQVLPYLCMQSHTVWNSYPHRHTDAHSLTKNTHVHGCTTHSVSMNTHILGIYTLI